MTSESEGERLELRECSFGRVGVSGATVHGSTSLVTVPTVRTSQMNQNLTYNMHLQKGWIRCNKCTAWRPTLLI